MDSEDTLDAEVDASATTHPLVATTAANKAPTSTKDRRTRINLTIDLRIIERMVGYLSGQVNDESALG